MFKKDILYNCAIGILTLTIATILFNINFAI